MSEALGLTGAKIGRVYGFKSCFVVVGFVGVLGSSFVGFLFSFSFW
jgi:hypothetical protein